MLMSPVSVGATGKECDHWFIRHTGNHTPPTCDSRFSYMDRYAAYYMDQKAAEDDRKIIYLTFDAGYENGNISKVLDVLKEEHVPAAFFILQNMVDKNLYLLNRMVEEGHLICNHTARHKDMSKADEAAFCAELQKMEQVYRDATGKELAKFYRPPEGKFVEQNLKWAQDMGYTTVLWSFAYADWDNKKQPSEQLAKEKILQNVHSGEIMLLHPTSATNAAILGDVIRTLKNEGYVFKSLTELAK
jgi:peptidoglycan-N-acetylmuramic acid deacetylase